MVHQLSHLQLQVCIFWNGTLIFHVRFQLLLQHQESFELSAEDIWGQGGIHYDGLLRGQRAAGSRRPSKKSAHQEI
jgi:hypothetical protein